MMNEKNQPKAYWVEAACTVFYLVNRCTTSNLHYVTSHDKYCGTKPNLSHLRIFGTIAFVHIPDKKWQNLDPK